LVNYQIQFIRSRDALPITRRYMIDAEDQLRPDHFSEPNSKLPAGDGPLSPEAR
jgi:hypothetical protein